MNLPQGAKKILDARLSGNRPAGGIFVESDWGSFDHDANKVKVQFGCEYDFDFLTGLQVFVLHDGYSGEVSKTAADILKCSPEFVAVIGPDCRGYLVEAE